MSVRWSGQPNFDFLKDPEFANFRTSLDAEMKRLQQLGVGATKKQAEILTELEEEILWAGKEVCLVTTPHRPS